MGRVRLAVTTAVAAMLLVGCAVTQPAVPTDDPAAGPSSSGTPAAPGDPAAEPTAPAQGAANVLLQGVLWDDATATLHATGMVTDVVEDGGSCTLSLEPAAGTGFEVVTAAIAGPAVTYCGRFDVVDDRLVPGTWTAVLTYDSDDSSGESDRIEIEVTG